MNSVRWVAAPVVIADPETLAVIVALVPARAVSADLDQVAPAVAVPRKADVALKVIDPVPVVLKVAVHRDKDRMVRRHRRMPIAWSIMRCNLIPIRTASSARTNCGNSWTNSFGLCRCHANVVRAVPAEKAVPVPRAAVVPKANARSVLNVPNNRFAVSRPAQNPLRDPILDATRSPLHDAPKRVLS